MGILSIFFKKTKRTTEWQNLIDASPDQRTKEVLEYIVDNFFIPDKISPLLFKANYEIIRHHSRDSYHSHAVLMNDPDLSGKGTKNIDVLAQFGNQPLGYSDWFIAAYPDVVNWFQDVDDERAASILDAPSEDDIFDEERKIKASYLRKIVNSFGNKLECSN